jgi:hypothetical protein
MRGDTGFVIVRARLPGLSIEGAGILETMFEFGTRACDAELDDGAK